MRELWAVGGQGEGCQWSVAKIWDGLLI